MRVYITKYALTAGILEVDGEVSSNSPTLMGFKYPADNWWYSIAHGEGKEWHRSLEAAQARAKQMRDKKIASLRKQIAKLESIEEFKVVGGEP